MNARLVLAGAFFALLPTTLLAAAPPKIHKTAIPIAAATMYECSKCHMKVSVAVAKKDHYKDTMDGGTLVPVKTAHK